MSDLQGEASEIEQPTPEDKSSTHKADLWTLATTFALAFYIGWRLLDAIDSEIVRAHLLRMFVKMFARAARYMGEQALLAEQLYYDTVRSIH